MRIFNWVHRRFIRPKDGSNDEQKLRKDDEGFDKSDDYHAIFSIGTFGQHDHDRSSFESWEDDESESESDDDDDHPLLLYTSSSTKTADIVVAVEEEEEEEDDDEMARKKERTTLAELFSAESKDDRKTTSKSTTNTAAKHEAGSLLFVKKKWSSSKQDSRPIHKLHGLMKRMLKRKIHPAADFSVHVHKPSPKISVSHHGDTPTHHQLWT